MQKSVYISVHGPLRVGTTCWNIYNSYLSNVLANVLRGRVHLYVSCVILLLRGCQRVGLVRSQFDVWLIYSLNLSSYLQNKLDMITICTLYIIEFIVLILYVIEYLFISLYSPILTWYQSVRSGHDSLTGVPRIMQRVEEFAVEVKRIR